MKIFIISTLLFFIYITLDIVFNDQLWQWNTNLTIYLQENQFTFEKGIMNFFSNQSYIFWIIAILIYLFTDNKLGTVQYACFVLFISSLNSILKNIYHQPRPFWEVEMINGLQCNKEFGKPSGHAMGSFAQCFLLPCILFPPLFHHKLIANYKKIITSLILIILSIWCFMTGLSRIYFGVHSFGQVLLGWVFTSYLLLNYQVYLHKKINLLFKEKLSQNGKAIDWKDIIYVFIFIIIWILISLLFYKLNSNDILAKKVDLIKWIAIMKRKCLLTKLNTIEDSNILQNNCFNNSFQILFIFYILLFAKIGKGTYDEGQFTEQLIKMKWYKIIIRIILLPIINLILIPVINNIQSESLAVSITAQNIPIYLILSFNITILYPQILKYLELDIEGDFLRARVKVIKIIPAITNGEESSIAIQQDGNLKQQDVNQIINSDLKDENNCLNKDQQNISPFNLEQ